MKLITFIPYSPHKDLVSAYNECMELVPDGGWGCFLDHDVMFTTYHWFRDISKYIEEHPEYSCFVPVTNRIGGRKQKVLDIGDDMVLNRQLGEKWRKEKGILDFTIPTPHHFSGVCIVLNKQAWKEIGGFKQWNESKILGIDSRLHQDLYDNGFKTAIMKGVYLYHWYSGGGKRDTKHLE